jgi:hypothetical protein
LGQVMIRGNWAPERCPLTMASMMDGWSDPKLTKQCVTPSSHNASKNANDAVYILPVDAARVVAGTVRGHVIDRVKEGGCRGQT